MFYPSNPKKYTGSIFKKHNKWKFVLRYQGLKHYRSFDNRNECIQYMRDYNIQHSLPVKNIYYDMGDHFEVELTHFKSTKIDKADINVIDKYVWCASNSHSFYACTFINGKHTKLHNVIMNHWDYSTHTVDHINRDSLDNRRRNLRLASHSLQMINRGKTRRNKSGHIGVYYDKTSKRWVANWTINKVRTTKKFRADKPDAKQKAIYARFVGTFNLYHPRQNYP